MLTFIVTKLLFTISVERIKNGSLFEIKKKIRPVTNHNDMIFFSPILCVLKEAVEASVRDLCNKADPTRGRDRKGLQEGLIFNFI